MNKCAKCLLFLIVIFTSYGAKAMMKGDGSTGYIEILNTSALNPAAITYSAWVYINALPATYAGIISRKPGGAAFTVLYVRANGKLACYINSPNLNYDGTGISTLTANTWYHLAMTYDSNVGLNGYVNGFLDGHVNPAGGMNDSGGSYFIFDDTFTAGRFFNGYIDDVIISSRAFSAQEILSIARSGERLHNTDISLMYYPMDEGINGTTASGLCILDRSGNNLTGFARGTIQYFGSTRLNYP